MATATLGAQDAPPAPDARLPLGPATLAAQLRSTNAGLARSIDAWRRDGDVDRGYAPDDVQRWALHQQRILRLLAARPSLSARVARRLGPSGRAHARAVSEAVRSLRRLAASDRRRSPGVRVGAPRPAGELLGFYRAAQRRFGVGWHVLAAVNYVETAFGKLRNRSSAGAQGPMQFIPSTWRAYGMGGNVRDPRDAIMGAANYLRASGAPRSYGRALYAYNPSTLYVGAVLRYARRMARDPRAFYGFYAYSVFWRERRVTGPGL